MADSIVAGSAATSSYSAADEPSLVLNADDYLHICGLVEAAETSLSGSTDDDAPRASLRAAREFLLKHERTATRQPVTPLAKPQFTHTHTSRQALGEIALLTDTLGTLACELMDGGIEGHLHGACAHAMQQLAAQAGMLADAGMVALGGEPLKGADIAAWLMRRGH